MNSIKPSFLWRIRDLSHHEFIKLPLRNIETISDTKRRIAKESIIKYYEQTQTQYSVSDAQNIYLIQSK